MKKDFDRWNSIKKTTHAREDTDTLFVKDREVRWCRLGVNVGFEQDGGGMESQRPILILRKCSHKVLIAVPLSTVIKEGNPYYVSVDCPDGVRRSCIISQIRLIDMRRLTERMFLLGIEEFKEVRKKVRELFP